MKSLTITVKVDIDECDDGDRASFSHSEGVKGQIRKHLKEMSADVQRYFFESYDEITIRTEVK